MNLEITEVEKEVISQALDLYSRLLCGQYEELSTMYRYGKLVPINKVNERSSQLVDAHVFGLKHVLFPELSDHASYSIISDQAPEKAKIAYDIYNRLK
jgi:hypothetical protein